MERQRERLNQTEPQPEPQAAAERHPNGHFKKGVGGRPPGAGSGLGFWQQSAQTCLFKSGKRITKKAIQLALAGDVVLLKACLERLIAPASQTTAELERRLSELEAAAEHAAGRLH
jgi:hypothetical protein